MSVVMGVLILCLRGLGHRRHLQGLWAVDAGQDRPHRDFDRTVPPDLYRQAAAARPPVRPPADHGPGPRLRPRPPGAAADHRRSRPGRRSAADGARPVRRRDHARDLRRPQLQGRLGGNFDPARFQATIRQFGFTEQRYLAEQRRVSLRRQIAGTVSAGLEPPKAADRGAEPLPERAALDRIRQTRRRAGRHHRPAVAGGARRLFRRAQDPVPRARISQAVLRHDQSRGDRQMVRGLRRGRQKALRAEPQASSARRRSARSRRSCSRTRTKPRRRAAASRPALSFEDLAKERGLSPSDVDLGTDREIRRSSIPRSPTPRSRCRRAK